MKVELEAEVDESRELHLQLPTDIKIGKVKIIVSQEEPALATSKEHDVDAFFEKLESFEIKPRSREEIDKALQQERDDWY